jgi:hypothetical protein
MSYAETCDDLVKLELSRHEDLDGVSVEETTVYPARNPVAVQSKVPPMATTRPKIALSGTDRLLFRLEK